MITCKDCYLYDGCIAGHMHCYDEEGIKKNCKSFKDKNNYVEVVRCEDCQFYKPFIKVEDFDGRCLVHCIQIDKEFYCQYGKRKQK